MAEKIVSPGVFTDEIDASFLPAAIGEIGAAIIGPTVKGPALVPTVVTSFSEYEQLFGNEFKSGCPFVVPVSIKSFFFTKSPFCPRKNEGKADCD